jgi:hypothetical protein
MNLEKKAALHRNEVNRCRARRHSASISRMIILVCSILFDARLGGAEESPPQDVSFRMHPRCTIYAPALSNKGLPAKGLLDVFVVLDIVSTGVSDSEGGPNWPFPKGQKYTVKTKELFSLECFFEEQECRAFKIDLSSSTWKKNEATGSSTVGRDRMVLRNIKVSSVTSQFATVIWDNTTTLTVDTHLGKVSLRTSFPPERGSDESIGEGSCAPQ